VTRIAAVNGLDFRLTADAWDFAESRAVEIATHWAKRVAAQPRLFNGRVLMLGRHEIAAGALRGEFVEADFAAFLAWREFGFPPANACNGFSMAALRAADGAFLLGEMAPHTASAGAIYFPAGTPDRQDLVGDVVDLDASARRELLEETGLSAEEAEVAPGWTVVFAPGRVACMKSMRLTLAAEEARAEIAARLSAQPQPEFSAIHIVRRKEDFTPAMPAFVRAYMEWTWAAESRGLRPYGSSSLSQ
jgi:8-oxo-dGTP pyrophosphatase MutT (NUDIX family)